MWSHYFQCAEIHAWDINDPAFHPKFNESGAKFTRVDQLNLTTMDEAAFRIAEGAPNNHIFDLVVDDGKHSTVSMWNTFVATWPYLKNRGIYIAEDLHGCLFSKEFNLDGDKWGWCDQPEGQPTMFQLLRMFNASQGVAVAEKFNLPRLETWRRFAEDVESITFHSKGYRCDLWPAKIRRHCQSYKCYLRSNGLSKERCHSTTAVIIKKATAVPAGPIDLHAMWAADKERSGFGMSAISTSTPEGGKGEARNR